MEICETFDILNVSQEHYNAIQELFESGKIYYFGENKRKCRSVERFFNSYVTHRILIRIRAKNPSIIGYAEVTNYPNIPALPPDCWMDWIKFHYCLNLPVSVTNTCFFNNFIYRKDYSPELVRQVLCEVFYREPKLKFIISPRCPTYRFDYQERDKPNYYCLETFATIFYPKCYNVKTCPLISKIYVIHRNTLIPVMRYRRALPEDNDDIVDIVDDDRPDVKEQLGDFYIAEELLSESNSFFIVTEINHLTSGFIWLNDDVNIFQLLENYDLEPFGNLLKYNAKEIFRKKQIFITYSKTRPLNELFATNFVEQIYKNDEDSSTYSEDMIASDDTIFERDSQYKKYFKLVETLNENDYFIELRRKKLIVYYNVHESEQLRSIDAKSNVFAIQLFGLMSSYDVRRIFRFLLAAFAAYPDKDYCALSVCVANTMTTYLSEMVKHFILVQSRPGCRIDEYLYITHRSTIYGQLSLYPVREEDVADIEKMFTEELPKTFPKPKPTSKFCIPTISSRLSIGEPSFIDSDKDLHPKDQNDLELVKSILTNIFEDPFTKYKCITIRCGDSSKSIDDNALVGFAIVKPFYSARFLHKHYYIEKKCELSKLMMAELVILKLHPLFHSQSDVVFRELARQSNFCHFYHFRPTIWQHLNISHVLNTFGYRQTYRQQQLLNQLLCMFDIENVTICDFDNVVIQKTPQSQRCLPNDLVMNMQPLEPRRTKKIWFGKFDESPSSENTEEPLDIEENNIDFLNDRFLAYENNLGPSELLGHALNIVILGFTDICKAFLRLMIFNWHNTGQNYVDNCLPHINITVICAPGVMEAENERSFRCDTCQNQEDCWVNFQNSDAFIKDVRDRMDVRAWVRFVSGKVAAIKHGSQLVIMENGCEIYYVTLLLMCSTEFGIPQKMFANTVITPNYSHINNRFDKLIFYHKLKILKDEFTEDYKKSIVVYGSHITAFEFINFLIEHGIKGNEIHLVMPFNMAHAQLNLVLNNPAVDLRIEGIVREMLEDLAVTIYERMNLTEFSFHDDEKCIKNVTFLSPSGDNELTLECDLFVSFYETHIAAPTLQMLKEANIDIEGDFVIVNRKYETSLQSVYAIGNFIKHKEEPNHQYQFVSPQEAAKKIIHILDSDHCGETSTLEEKKFSEPFYFQAQLPFDHCFVKVITPKRYLANHLDNEYGLPLITYYEGDFSRIRLNELGIVEEIVVVTKKKMDFDFLKFFCGRHELLLNNLRSKWYLKDIVSFIDFFQELWVELIMHDQFQSLRLLNKLLVTATAQEIAKKNFDRETKHKIMHLYCQDLGITSQLEYALLDFIREHRRDFSSKIALPEDFPDGHREQYHH